MPERGLFYSIKRLAISAVIIFNNIITSTITFIAFNVCVGIYWIYTSFPPKHFIKNLYN